MKKFFKWFTYIFITCIVLSYLIPKGGPDWWRERPKNLVNHADYEIVVDFSKPSCQDRLFIYKFYEEADLIYSGVVLHGQGGNSTPSKPEFSNEIGSNCSSLGEYTLEGIVRMKNGMEAIKLKGWDKTNSNAEARGIYIHPCTLATLLPFNIPNANFPLTDASNGCFAVSYHTYKKIKQYMRLANVGNDKMVLYAYY